MSAIKVVVVESDASSRLALVSMLKAVSDISVVALASDVMQARMQVKLRQPDVVLIAIEQHTEQMEMFLTELVASNALPALMLSDKILPANAGERQALRCGGAMIMKPIHGVASKDQALAQKIILQLQRIVTDFKSNKVITPQATQSRSVRFKQNHPKQNQPKPGQSKNTTVSQHPPVDRTVGEGKTHHPVMNTLLAIGASTGGTNALRHVVNAFPADFSAVVIVQHIPKAFAASFIDKLNKASPMHVISACDGDEILHGHVYVGAGDEHFCIEKKGSMLICRVGGKDKVSGHCPSVNALFDSVAKHVGSKSVGALMTGMGEDGATGLKRMRDARAKTVAQDKESSVVWGMPGVAVKLGAAEIEVPLDQLGEKLVQLVQG